MPFQYSNEEKITAFKLLIETMGDVNHVSNETGISKRTLQYWKSRYRVKVTAEPTDMPEKTDQFFKDQYRFIRQKLFKRVTIMLDHMEKYRTPEEMADLVPALTRLIDRLHKMEEMITESHFTFSIKWLNPEIPETNEFKIEGELLKEGKRFND